MTDVKTVNDGVGFMISQLSALESTVYETKYPHIQFKDLVPIDFSIGENEQSFSYISYDAVTAGKFIGASAKDLPTSDVNATIHTGQLYYGGNGFSYSLDEMRTFSKMGQSVDATKAKVSRRGYEEHAQQVAYFGDTARGLTGLFNNSNVQVDNDGGLNYKTGDVDAIVEALNAPLKTVWANSKEMHVPNVVVLPSSIWSTIATRRMPEGYGGMTVLKFFQENNLYTQITQNPLTIKTNISLETAGTGGKPRMMAYELNSENLVMHIPFEWRPVAPQADDLRIKVAAEYKIGGVEYRYPGSAAYRDFTG